MKECLLQADEKGTDQELTKLSTVLDRCGVIINERKAGMFMLRFRGLSRADPIADFVSKNIEQDVNRLLDETSSNTVRRELLFRY